MTHLKKADLIEPELKNQYEHDGNKNRAVLFNLVIFTLSKDRADYLTELLKKIIEKFPCRILFIKEDPTWPGGIEFEVSTNLNPKVSCDLIEIFANITDQDKIPSLLLQHLIPDLPVYVLWGSDPTLKNDILPLLCPYADRIIFDTISVPQIGTFAKKILDDKDPRFRDVIWTALTGWRQALAKAFEAPEQIEGLKSLSELTIHYNNSNKNKIAHPEADSIYLLAWLSSKLNWDLKSVSATEFAFKNGGKATLIPEVNDKFLTGDILQLNISTQAGQKYYFTRKNGSCILHIENPLECYMPLTLPLPYTQRGFPFWRDLFFEDISPDYYMMLKELAKGQF